MLRHLRAYYRPAWRFASRQFLYACLLDVQALKPGNVGLHADGHGKTCRDYRQSAQASAELVCHPDWPLGKRVRKAAEATWEVVGCNTNIGTLLLAAPLAGAYHRQTGESLESRLQQVLDETTQADAAEVYRALRLMQPGGLGRVPEADVHAPPKLPLRDAMALAAARDRVAAEYCTGYSVVLTQARPLWEELCRRWGDARWAMAGTFLNLLARHPDSHIARMHGDAAAREISGKIAPLADEFCGAEAPEAYRPKLLELDASWKNAGLSPGTTADLTLAGVFAARLDGWSEHGSMLPRGDDSRTPSGASE